MTGSSWLFLLKSCFACLRSFWNVKSLMGAAWILFVLIRDAGHDADKLEIKEGIETKAT